MFGIRHIKFDSMTYVLQTNTNEDAWDWPTGLRNGS